MELLWLYVLLGVAAALLAGYGIGRLVRKKLPPRTPEAPPALPEGEVPKEGPPEGEAPAQLEAPGKVPPPPTPAAPEPPPTPEAPTDNLFRRLVKGLAKTQSHLVDRFDSVIRGRKEIDETLYEELESVLITADVGVKTTRRLLDELRDRVSREELRDPAALRGILKEHIKTILCQQDAAVKEVEQKPLVILVVGVNGTGKTTTIGKLASRFSQAGKSVILAAGDTFRAAAIEQLEVWADRAGATLIKNKEGSDPASVIYDALQAAKARGTDVVIADTAGRLHTKLNLMDELKKVHRVIGKAISGAPHEVLLVLDATMGQNAMAQARVFHEGTSLSGLVLTKLDGTARGGIVIGIVGELGLPVKFIGVGEQLDDLQSFDPEQFVSALF